MAYTIDSRAESPANQLRDALDRAEDLVVSVNSATVEEFLTLLDQIEQMLAELDRLGSDLRPERSRWDTLLGRVANKPGPIVAAGNQAGGWPRLRADHPPATSFWWHVDSQLTRQRTRSAVRVGLMLAAVAGALALVLWAVNYFFPPNPEAVRLMEANSGIDALVTEQRWAEALAVVQEAKLDLPDSPELAIWETVLYERLGDAQQAAAAQARAQRLLADQPMIFWVELGNKRWMVGDLDGAEAAGQEAMALDDQDGQAYFLLATVAEARGDTLKAMDLFDRAFQLTKDSNPQLAVIARMRMGMLLQRGPSMPAESPLSPTPTP